MTSGMVLELSSLVGTCTLYFIFGILSGRVLLCFCFCVWTDTPPWAWGTCHWKGACHSMSSLSSSTGMDVDLGMDMTMFGVSENV